SRVLVRLARPRRETIAQAARPPGPLTSARLAAKAQSRELGVQEFAVAYRRQLLLVEAIRSVHEPEHRRIVEVAIELEPRAMRRTVVVQFEQRHAHAIELHSLSLMDRHVAEQVVRSDREEPPCPADQLEGAGRGPPEEAAPRTQRERSNAGFGAVGPFDHERREEDRLRDVGAKDGHPRLAVGPLRQRAEPRREGRGPGPRRALSKERIQRRPEEVNEREPEDHELRELGGPAAWSTSSATTALTPIMGTCSRRADASTAITGAIDRTEPMSIVTARPRRGA